MRCTTMAACHAREDGWTTEGKAGRATALHANLTFINLGVNLSRVLLIYVASHRDARSENFLASS